MPRSVGEIRAEPEELVLLDTALGGNRIVDMLVADPLCGVRAGAVSIRDDP
jgi:hydrogenase maturation factor